MALNIKYSPEGKSRAIKYREALARQSAGSFYEESFTRDTLGTAATILGWTMCPGDANKFLQGKNPIPPKTVKATKDCWKIKPISKKCGTLALHQFIKPEDIETLRMGHIPEVQEDHWFMWCDDTHMRFHRSWSGVCVFEAEYKELENGEGYEIGDVKVNLDPGEVTPFGPEASYILFRCLLRAEIASKWDLSRDVLLEWDWEKFLKMAKEGR